MPPPLLVALARRGLTVDLAGDRLAVRPAAALTDADRAAIRAGKAELVRYLSPPAAGWDANAARALLADADALVERLGVPNTHPELRTLATSAVEAVAGRDLLVLVGRVRRFEQAAVRLAAGAGQRRTP